MSFNFGNTMKNASPGFTFGTPAGDAKTLKTEFSLFGSTATTQSSLGFTSPVPGNNPLNTTSVQSTPTFGSSDFGSAMPLGASTFGTAPPSYGVNRAVPLAYGATTTSAPLLLGTQTVQPVLPLFGATEPQTFKSLPKSGLLGNTMQSFATPGQAAPMFAGSTLQPTASFAMQPQQATLPTFGVAQVAPVNAIGTPTQATMQSFNVASPIIGGSSFGPPQSTAAAATQFTFCNSSLAMPNIASTSSITAPLSIPSVVTQRPATGTIQPTFSSFNLGSSAAAATAVSTIETLDSSNIPSSTLPLTFPTISTTTTTTTPVVSNTISAPGYFNSETAAKISTNNANISATIPIPNTTGIIIPSTSGLTASTQGISKPLGSTLPAFGSLAPNINATSVPPTLPFGVAAPKAAASINLTSSPIPTITTAAAATPTTYASVVPSIPSSIPAAFPISDGTIAKTFTTTSTTTAITTPTTIMSYRKLEDMINKWASDLENQSKIFTNQAKQLNAWDRLLISNGDKILSLNNGIERVKEQQHQLDQELDFIRAQQMELEHLIVPMEKELQKAPVLDTDRNHTYQVAENMDSQLKKMSEDLKEIIETLNESNKSQELANPIMQIGRILNAHMNSLQWIDVNTNKISSQLDQISKMHDLTRRNHEIVLQRTYD